MALTKRQRLFVDEFCKDPKCGAAKAAFRAGFSKKRAKVTACELMKNQEVQQEIERRMNKTLERAEVTKETVVGELLDVIEACKQAGAGAWQMTARLKATELLGKHLKMFSDRVELGLDDALMEKLLEGRRRAGITGAQPPMLEGNVVN